MIRASEAKGFEIQGFRGLGSLNLCWTVTVREPHTRPVIQPNKTPTASKGKSLLSMGGTLFYIVLGLLPRFFAIRSSNDWRNWEALSMVRSSHRRGFWLWNEPLVLGSSMLFLPVDSANLHVEYQEAKPISVTDGELIVDRCFTRIRRELRSSYSLK